MKQLVGIGCALITLVLLPATASADEDEPQARVVESPSATIDTIRLRSGGLVHGRVTEIVAGDHVSLIVPSGETQNIPWSDVERLIVATTSFPPRPPVVAPAPEVLPAPMVGPRARVHIESSGTAYLYRRAAGTTDFVTACESPCDLEMPLGDTYKVGGSGFTTTKELRLDARPGGSVRLSINGPNWFGIVGGGVLVIGGVFPTYLGLLLAPFAGLDDGVRDLALGCLGVGGAAIGVGVIAVYLSMQTDLTQKRADLTQKRSQPAEDASVRPPTWRSASTIEQGGAARATFPVLFERHF